MYNIHLGLILITSMGVRNMGKIIRLLATDDNAERITKIVEQIAEQYPDLQVEYPLDLKSLMNSLEIKTNPRLKNRHLSYSAFPDTPRVIARGKELFIVNEDGSEEFWGIEADENIEEIAFQMEMELRSLKWVKHELERVLSDLAEIMSYSQVPLDQIPNIVFEGYRSLLFCFKRIDESIHV